MSLISLLQCWLTDWCVCVSRNCNHFTDALAMVSVIVGNFRFSYELPILIFRSLNIRTAQQHSDVEHIVQGNFRSFNFVYEIYENVHHTKIPAIWYLTLSSLRLLLFIQKLTGTRTPAWVNRLAYVSSWMPFIVNCLPPSWITPGGVEVEGQQSQLYSPATGKWYLSNSVSYT